MAASATNIFEMTGVQPAFGPWGEAKRIAVKLPASVAYAKGTILGEIVGTNEVQTITVTGTPTGGSFTVTFAGATTSAIAYNASAATVQAALEALATIGTNNVACTGGALPGTAVTVTFQNGLGKQNVVAMTTTDSFTGGTSPASAVATATAGTGTANEVQVVYASGTVSGGTFTITYSGQTTSAIAYNATTAVVQAALEALSNLAPGDVVVTGTAGTRYILTFGGTLLATDVSAVTIGNGSITGGGSYLVATATAGEAGSNGTYKAVLSSSTDGSQTAKAILEFASATDSSGNITLGAASGGGDKQQTVTNVPAFVSGTFKCEDLLQTAGAGQLTEAAAASLGRIVQGSVTSGLIRLG
jgi:hypothetical protein